MSNAEELADWIRTVRGETEAVIEDRRPVELHNLYLLGDRSSERLLLFPTLVDGRPNPEVERARQQDPAPPGHCGAGPGAGCTRPGGPRWSSCSAEHDMLPAIYFIFSRAACDDAVAQCLREGQRLTTPEERRQIRAIAEAHVEALSDDDLRVLDYGAWITGLEAGFAAHHAGMVPPFKEAVEACFAAGLVKVVFATETLSLGINMPARSVVIEKLTKFTGERHEFLTPGEYTQLTGRAGRRGIDEVGYAVVLWSPFVPFDQVAGLAGDPDLRPHQQLPADLQHGRQPGPALPARRGPPPAQPVLRPVPGRQRRGPARGPAGADPGGCWPSARRAAACDRGDVDEYRARLRASEEPAASGRR